MNDQEVRRALRLVAVFAAMLSVVAFIAWLLPGAGLALGFMFAAVAAFALADMWLHLAERRRR